jgi:HD-like signal output (HDOD) protein
MGAVMQELNSITRSDDSSAAQLAEIILKDASLTTKVLRIANSAYYNPNTDNPITTISRAVVQLGFKGIKAITLSVMLIDSLLQKKSKQRMLEWLARGFHAAVQAENLYQEAGGSEEDEEVFITTLLLHLGDMAFWSCKGDHSDNLDDQLDSNRASDAELEKQVLGASIKAISQSLAQQWDMGPALREALDPPHKPSQQTQAVLLGEQISLAAEQGWQSADFLDSLVDASRFTGLGFEDVKERVMANAERSAAVAVTYGANKICHFIPSTSEPEPEQVKAVKPKGLQSNPQLQLDILREIGAMVQQKMDVNTLFSMLVEGIHRGVGLERVALCLIDPKVTFMQAKYVLGEDTKHWREGMQFPVKDERDNIFSYCLHSRKQVWLNAETDDDLLDLVNRKMMKFIDDSNCLVSCVYAGNRAIGVLVADRGMGGDAISVEQFDSFCHFTQQANMALASLANKKKGP